MRIDKLKINDFKNLKDFQIDIDESQLTSVFIGRNGAGKSNLLEAIVIIFRDLDLGVFTKDFSYEIFYRCSGHAVRVKNNVSESKQEFLVDGKVLTRTNFYKQKREYLRNMFLHIIPDQVTVWRNISPSIKNSFTGRY